MSVLSIIDAAGFVWTGVGLFLISVLASAPLWNRPIRLVHPGIGVALCAVLASSFTVAWAAVYSNERTTELLLNDMEWLGAVGILAGASVVAFDFLGRGSSIRGIRRGLMNPLATVSGAIGAVASLWALANPDGTLVARTGVVALLVLTWAVAVRLPLAWTLMVSYFGKVGPSTPAWFVVRDAVDARLRSNLDEWSAPERRSRSRLRPRTSPDQRLDLARELFPAGTSIFDQHLFLGERPGIELCSSCRWAAGLPCSESELARGLASAVTKTSIDVVIALDRTLATAPSERWETVRTSQPYTFEIGLFLRLDRATPSESEKIEAADKKRHNVRGLDAKTLPLATYDQKTFPPKGVLTGYERMVDARDLLMIWAVFDLPTDRLERELTGVRSSGARSRHVCLDEAVLDEIKSNEANPEARRNAAKVRLFEYYAGWLDQNASLGVLVDSEAIRLRFTPGQAVDALQSGRASEQLADRFEGLLQATQSAFALGAVPCRFCSGRGRIPSAEGSMQSFTEDRGSTRSPRLVKQWVPKEWLPCSACARSGKLEGGRTRSKDAAVAHAELGFAAQLILDIVDEDRGWYILAPDWTDSIWNHVDVIARELESTS